MRCLFLIPLSLTIAASAALAEPTINNEVPAPAQQEPTSVPRRTAGEALTIVGIVHLIVGSVVTGVYAYETRPGPANSIDGGCRACFPPFPNFIGPAILASSAIYAGVGIPLWVSGALPKKGSSVAAPEAASLRAGVGPGSATLTMTF